jgi:hypothetical protein
VLCGLLDLKGQPLIVLRAAGTWYSTAGSLEEMINAEDRKSSTIFTFLVVLMAVPSMK